MTRRYHPMVPIALAVLVAAGVLGAMYASGGPDPGPKPRPAVTTTTTPSLPTSTAVATTTTVVPPTTVAATTTTPTIPPVVATTTVAAPSTTTGTPSPTTVLGAPAACATVWQPGAPTPTQPCTLPDGTSYTGRVLPCTDGTTLVLGAPDTATGYLGRTGGTLTAVTPDQAIEAATACAPDPEAGR